ncbi:competence ComEA-like helix-hairpin-helix protein [Planomicrobium koreense]|uniref:Competence ComEA-like helix-hairpin-helix protein n=1 Tax=Planococcus koreensis TaxID=112331 RepID=A0A7W8FUQ0_9BACL|nr:MBL fold metallo-hydrolase [Planococcus koreensis]MBB5181361.1 competence ComEA-like helix-hairpin-helix protein [Planococcus koreensis]
MKKKWLFLVGILVMALFLAGCLERVKTPADNDTEKPAPPERNAGELTAHFIDVGQGDATLFETEDYAILIDTGNWNDTDAVEYLEKLGVSKIDIVVGTHPDSDHIGQLDKVIEQFEVSEVWLSGNVSTSDTFIRALEAIEANSTDYYEPRTGETFDVGGMEIEVLHPAEVTGKGNEESISMKITYKDVSFIMTGDAGVKEEQEMIDSGAELDAEILHLGHHGSNTSSGTAFLKAVSPEVAIYSAGIDNSYGHPHAEVIAAAENAGAKVYGTDVNGTVRVETDGISYEVLIEKDGIAVEGKNRCIDINIASSAELQEIEGIGPALAEAIIEARPFDAIEELDSIKGIGQGKIDAIKEQGLACIGG